jgi:hypothetical protein
MGHCPEILWGKVPVQKLSTKAFFQHNIPILKVNKVGNAKAPKQDVTLAYMLAICTLHR